MAAYYNEIDPFAAQWLRNLIAGGHIAPGDVDERSIEDVTADDLRGYVQCHFFAGIGGWSYALRLAGWPDDEPVWTGSCPCQPFSKAGKMLGSGDKRHLWPELYRLIHSSAAKVVFGEQVAGSLGETWLDSVEFDLEGTHYLIAGVLQAGAVGSPQERERIYFVADPISPAAAGRDQAWRRAASYRSIPRRWDGAEGNVSIVRNRYELLANGIPSGMAKKCAGGFGNAIVPQVAAEFISAYMETI